MSTSAFLLTMLVPLFGQDAQPSSENNCFANFGQLGSNFDVCELQLISQLPHYQIEDSKNDPNSTDKYKYIFNIGGSVVDINDIPICSPTAQNHSYCVDSNHQPCVSTSTDDQNMIAISRNVWAYQVKFTGNNTIYNNTACYYLSGYDGGPPSWRLINDLNPVEGVVLTYQDGDYSSTCGKNREFSIKFECEDTGERFMPSNQGLINEYEICSYTWTVQSLHGCPTQCPRAHEKLCAGNGLCSYDNTLNASRCYCFGKMTGSECLIPDDNIKIWDITKTKPTDSPFVKTLTGQTLEKQNYTVTYDLSKFKLEEGTSSNYQVLDKFNEVNENNNDSVRDNFRYFMGIAQKIQIPSECKNYVNLSKVSGEAYAVQMNENTKYCFVLGNEVTWDIVDTIDDPARGVSLRYTGGSDEGCFGSNREFTVSMVCPDYVRNSNNREVFDSKVQTRFSAYVEEPVVCSYAIEIETAIACPYDCINDDGVGYFDICSQHGMCVSDPLISQVRCLCDSLWHGALCKAAPTNSPTPSPTPLPTKSPTLKPTPYPTLKPTTKPTGFPTGSPLVAQVIVKEQKDNHTAFIISILGLVLVVIVAIFIGRFCYKKMRNTHEEFKEYTQFRDNTKKKKGSIGFSMKGNSGMVNVADNSDDDNEEHNDDQLL